MEHVRPEATACPLTIVIVDDHAVFRSSARALLEAAGYAVVGEAADAAGGIEETRRLRPDVLLLDVGLPDEDGIAVAHEVSTWPGAPRIVLISGHDASDLGSRLQGAPVRGFIHKPQLSRASFAHALSGTDPS